MASPAPLSRLSLTPKGASLRLPEQLYEPKPDWTLDDLKHELDALSTKFKKNGDVELISPVSERHSPSPHGFRFAWKDRPVHFNRETRTFRISAFDDDEDEDEDDEGSAQITKISLNTQSIDNVPSTKKQSSSAAGILDVANGPCLLPENELVGGSLFELERDRLLKVQEETRRQNFLMQSTIEEESRRLVATFEQIDKEEARKHELAQRKDKQYQRTIAEARDLHLSALQHDHAQHSQVEEQKIKREAAAAEEARMREMLARRELEQREKLKAEAQAKQNADALLAAEQAKIDKAAKEAAAAAAVLQRQMEAKREAPGSKAQSSENTSARGEPVLARMSSGHPKSGTGQTVTSPKPKISEMAAKLETARHKKMAAFREVSLELQSKPELIKDLRGCGRFIGGLLQKITATQENVRFTSLELMRVLGERSMQHAFCVTTFASKLISQCETLNLRLPSFLFTLAQVVVNVSIQIPDVMEIVLANLHEVCILTVPKSFEKNGFENERAYLKALGYQEEEGKLENTQDFVARMSAYVTFYAAITQVDGSNPHGIKEAWAWCARVLNTLPVNHLTASALEAFLKVAGYRLWTTYRKAFEKLIQVISTDFMKRLKQQNDADSRVSLEKLNVYVHTRRYLQEPDGRQILVKEKSAMTRA